MHYRLEARHLCGFRLRPATVQAGLTWVILCILLAIPRSASAGSGREAAHIARELEFMTKAYQDAALRLLLREANRVAVELHLPEELPITRKKLVGYYISPPSIGKVVPGLGNISTHRYRYYVSVGNKFSYIEQLSDAGGGQELDKLKAEAFLPISRLDTNRAYQIATQWLSAISMDVNGLDRDCVRRIRAWTPEGKKGAHFVPLYWVSWGKQGEPVALVELFEPTKTLIQLRVEKSEYIFRRPLLITNIDVLLPQTDVPRKANVPEE